MKLYDSKIEQQYHTMNPYLIRVTDVLPLILLDSDSKFFRAKVDFINPLTKEIIEIKGKALNTVKSISDSNIKLQKANQYCPRKWFYNSLNYGWNHSIYKQAIVSQALKAQDYSFKIVFLNLQKPLSKQAQNKMNALDLTFEILRHTTN